MDTIVSRLRLPKFSGSTGLLDVVCASAAHNQVSPRITRVHRVVRIKYAIEKLRKLTPNEKKQDVFVKHECPRIPHVSGRGLS